MCSRIFNRMQSKSFLISFEEGVCDPQVIRYFLSKMLIGSNSSSIGILSNESYHFINIKTYKDVQKFIYTPFKWTVWRKILIFLFFSLNYLLLPHQSIEWNAFCQNFDWKALIFALFFFCFLLLLLLWLVLFLGFLRFNSSLWNFSAIT